jgi:electron transfer flavoprotein-quinone oxidoreductase
MSDEEFDVIVVGAGVAGTVCAYQLAAAGRSVVLIERGAQPGTKNLSGGVLYCRVMEEVFPGFAQQAPVERRIVRNCLSLLNQDSFVNIDYWDRRLAAPANAFTVLRSRLDPWLAERCEEAGVMVMPGVRVDGLLSAGGRFTGVRAGDDELRARVVVAADGVNSFIARGAGLRAAEPSRNLAVGVKSVIGLPRAVIEERFNLTGDEGAAYAVVGDCTQGVAGGGFMYTNIDSISIGVVLRLDDLARRGLASSDLHDHFLHHPAIAPFLRDGELREYGCHLVAEGGKAMVHDLVRDGLVVIGEAAGLALNTGLTVRGMDLAAGSAVAAAGAIDAALGAGDVSAARLADYERRLAASFVGRDMATYARTPKFLEEPAMYGDMETLLADVLHRAFDHDLTARRRLVRTALGAARSSGMSVPRLARIGLRAARAV